MAKREAKPDVFAYASYRAFLRDWVAYQKSENPGFSMRGLLGQVGLPLCTVSTILSGDMKLSDDTLKRVSPGLKLNRESIGYLKVLRDIEEADSQAKRLKAFRSMQSYLLKRGINLKENQMIKYLSDWYKVAIRELSLQPGFKPDPEWIQDQLVEHVPLRDVKKALQFLIKSGMIDPAQDQNGKSEEYTQFKGGFYRMALAEYVGQYLDLTKQSMSSTPREERHLRGYTASFTEEEFQKIKGVLDGAMKEVIELRKERSGEKDSDQKVYHLSLGFVPVTKGKKKAG